MAIVLDSKDVQWMELWGDVPDGVWGFDELLKAADEAACYDELCKLSEQLYENKKCYTLAQLRFANEHFEKLVNKLRDENDN